MFIVKMLGSLVYQLVSILRTCLVNIFNIFLTHNYVVCSRDWELRLVNGGSSLEGRLEVCLNGVWGTICDDSWDDTDAGVACSQMRYSRRG